MLTIPPTLVLHNSLKMTHHFVSHLLDYLEKNSLRKRFEALDTPDDTVTYRYTLVDIIIRLHETSFVPHEPPSIDHPIRWTKGLLTQVTNTTKVHVVNNFNDNHACYHAYQLESNET